jgi:NAD-dependent SIR2 family protein deacetylase
LFKCPFCHEKMKTINTLREHIRKQHDYQVVRCPACGTKCKNISRLILHCSHRLVQNPNDTNHLALYVLLRRNSKLHGHGVKLPRQVTLMKLLKEVFKG